MTEGQIEDIEALENENKHLRAELERFRKNQVQAANAMAHETVKALREENRQLKERMCVARFKLTNDDEAGAYEALDLTVHMKQSAPDSSGGKDGT